MKVFGYAVKVIGEFGEFFGKLAMALTLDVLVSFAGCLGGG
jgi:hypothetical protein